MRRFLVMTLMVLLAALPAVSQPRPGEGPRAVERIEQLKKVRMIEALDLSEEQSIRFFARLNEHDKRNQDLMDERSAILDRLERLVRNEADDEEYRGLFSEVSEVDRRVVEEEAKFFDGLSEILSESQRARYLLFGRQFRRELQDALQFMHQRRGGP